jgi:hypothetical protein
MSFIRNHRRPISSTSRRSHVHLEVLEDRTTPTLLLGSGASVVLSPTEAPGSWYPERYAPAGFTAGAKVGGQVGVLDEFISASDKDGSRAAAYNSGFYDFQGRKFDLAAGTTYLAIDLYVPASWSKLTQQDPSGNHASWGSLANFWATGVNASGDISNYPIIGFNNKAGSGTGGFQVFDQTHGWTNISGFTGANQWYQIGFGISGGQMDYFVNGQLVYIDTTATGTTAFSNVMLQGYNGGNSYDIYWNNLRDTPVTAVGANISATGGTAFNKVVVASFTDPEALGHYSATITWGDQNGSGNPLTSQGTIVDLGGGHYQVVGSHTYAAYGTYAISVSITTADFATVTTSAALGTRSSAVIETTDVPGSWYPDRYAPAGFTAGQTQGGRVGVLDEFISAGDQNGSRAPEYNSGFYDFQGRTYALAAGTTYLAVDLYVPSSWSSLNQQDPNGNPASRGSLASLWATGVDASGNIITYPIMGFNNLAGSGTGGFRVYTDATGWTNVAGFTLGNQWYQLGIAIRAGQIDYFVNGRLVYTDTTATGTTAFSNVMLEGYNGGNNYHIFWGNLRTTRATVAAGLVVNAGPNLGLGVGATFTKLGSFTDTGATSWTATVNYGDGSGVQPLVLTPGRTFKLTHAYTRSGVYTVTVTVTANDGRVGTASFVVTVGLGQYRVS